MCEPLKSGTIAVHQVNLSVTIRKRDERYARPVRRNGGLRIIIAMKKNALLPTPVWVYPAYIE